MRGELQPGYKQTEVGVIPEDWEVIGLGKLRLIKLVMPSGRSTGSKNMAWNSSATFRTLNTDGLIVGHLKATCDRLQYISGNSTATGDIMIGMVGLTIGN